MVLILCWMLLACNKPNSPDCLQTAGVHGELQGSLTPFQHLIINDNLDYVLHIDSVWHYRIEGPFNLLNEIALKNNLTSLEISNENTCNIFRNKKRRITVHLFAPSYSHIKVLSQGTLTCADTLKSDLYIQYDNANCNSTWLIRNDSCNIEYPKGTGDILIKGQSNLGWIYSNALGKINGKNWIVQNLSVHHSSLQDIYTHPVQYLHAELHNKGNLWIPRYPLLWDKTETAEGRLKIEP